MRITLLAIEGFAHVVAGHLASLGYDVNLIVPYEPGSFPHYRVPDLEAFCADRFITLDVCLTDARANFLLSEGLEPLLVATWPWILPPATYERRPLAVNLHPGLVAGRDPWSAALERRDRYTGVIAHDLTPKVDEGRIHWVRTTPISSRDTVATLRERTAVLAADGAERVLWEIPGTWEAPR